MVDITTHVLVNAPPRRRRICYSQRLLLNSHVWPNINFIYLTHKSVSGQIDFPQYSIFTEDRSFVQALYSQFQKPKYLSLDK